ncbi:hypothetical protein SK128_018257 [Halocaridina rubra]|uniref:NACHT domain-containing protein n=1 Tax=Halocaridina rubra TaxID=373956 RepID=A0AAN8WIN6_HALRR
MSECSSLENESPPPLPSHDPLQQNAPQVPPRISREDIHVLQYFKALQPKGPVARCLAYAYLALTRVDNQSLIDYCRHTLHYTNTYIKSIFSPRERKLLSGNWDPLQQDITLLYKVMQHVCNLADHRSSVWITNSHSIEYLLQRIKQQRNFLAHEATTMTFKELVYRMMILETDSRAIIAHAGERSNKDMTAAEQEMEQMIRGLLRAIPSFISQTDYIRTMKELKEERIFKLNKFKNEVQTVLAAKYCHFTIISPAYWGDLTKDNLHVQDIFVYPEIKCEAGECVPFEKLIPEHKSQWMQVIVLQGVPGIGKTCLCQYIMNCWLTRNSNPVQGCSFPWLRDTDFLAPIQCAYVSKESFSEYLLTNIFQDNSHIASEDMLPLLRSLRVLLLVDGWDEGSSALKKMIRQVIRELPESRLVITVRPEFELEVKSDISPYISSTSHIWKTYNILGFNCTKREEYIQKVFNTMQKNLKEQKEKLTSDLRIQLKRLNAYAGETLKIPLALMTIINLCEDHQLQNFKVITRERIHQHILYHITERLVGRLKQSSEQMIHKDEFRIKCRKWFLALGKEAWISLKCHKSVLSEDSVLNLAKKCKVLGLDQLNMLSSTLRRCQFNRGDDHVLWEFEHSTLQQFLAAKYLYWKTFRTKNLISVLDFDKETVESYGYLGYLLTINFLAAILCQKGKITQQFAADFAYLLDVPDIRWQDIGWIIEECERNTTITSYTQPLLINKTVTHISSDMIELLVCTLQHTSLQIGSPFYISFETTNQDMSKLLDLLYERCHIPTLAVSEETDFCLLQKFLEEKESIPPYLLPSVVRISLQSPAQAKSLAFCLCSCLNKDEKRIAHLLCHNQKAVENIAVLMENLKPMNIYDTFIEMPYKFWHDKNLEFDLERIVTSCNWPGTLLFSTTCCLVANIVKGAIKIMLRKEISVHKISYKRFIDDPYANSVEERTTTLFDVCFDKVEVLTHLCNSISIPNSEEACHRLHQKIDQETSS